MPFDPGVPVGTTTGTFPGSDTGLSNPQLDTVSSLSKKLAAIPVIMKAAVPGASRRVLNRFDSTVPNAADVAAPPQVMRYDDALSQIDTVTSDELQGLQQQLYAAGLYAKTYYSKNATGITLGINDAPTASAYKNLLTEAARRQVPIQQVLDERTASRKQGGFPTDINQLGSGATKAVTLTHPDDLRAAIRNAGPNVIGRRPDASVEENFIAAYHNAEAGAGTPDANGNYTAGPGAPSALAEQYLQTVYPQEAYDNGFLGAFDTFRKMIGGTASG